MTKKFRVRKARFLLIAASLFLAATSALAEEEKPQPSTTDGETRHFELGVHGSYSVAPNERSSRKPGLGLFLGYRLSPWSVLSLKYDTRAHGAGSFHEEYEELTVSYKHWLSQGKRWSPYLQVGAGYARLHSSIIGNVAGVTTETTYTSRGDFTLQLGGGYVYALTKDVGLDFGLHLHSLGSPGTFHNKFLVGKVGLDVAF